MTIATPPCNASSDNKGGLVVLRASQEAEKVEDDIPDWARNSKSQMVVVREGSRFGREG